LAFPRHFFPPRLLSPSTTPYPQVVIHTAQSPPPPPPFLLFQASLSCFSIAAAFHVTTYHHFRIPRRFSPFRSPSSPPFHSQPPPYPFNFFSFWNPFSLRRLACEEDSYFYGLLRPPQSLVSTPQFLFFPRYVLPCLLRDLLFQGFPWHSVPSSLGYPTPPSFGVPPPPYRIGPPFAIAAFQARDLYVFQAFELCQRPISAAVPRKMGVCFGETILFGAFQPLS